MSCCAIPVRLHADRNAYYRKWKIRPYDVGWVCSCGFFWYLIQLCHYMDFGLLPTGAHPNITTILAHLSVGVDIGGIYIGLGLLLLLLNPRYNLCQCLLR